jgi:hypothetical protein
MPPYRGPLETVFFDPIPGRLLEAVGFATVVRDNSSAKTSSSAACENEVKASPLAEVSGSST